MIETNHVLNEADRTLHSLAQLIALTAMQPLPGQPDDCQVNMVWNDETQQLEGRPFMHDGESVRMVIDLPSFTVQFMGGSLVFTALSASGHHLLPA